MTTIVDDCKMIVGKECDDDAVRRLKKECHALIYTDGSIAITMYECCYYMWLVRSGKCHGSPEWMRQSEWKLSDESLMKIREYVKKTIGEE